MKRESPPTLALAGLPLTLALMLPLTLVLSLALAPACSPRSTVLAIAVSNIPQTTTTLEITLTIDGKPYPANPPFAYDQARGATTVLTGIEIPWDFSDRLV